MGNRIKGVIVSKEPIFERMSGEPLPEPLPIAQRAERVKEYREKRSRQTEKAEKPETVQAAEDAVIRKPYVVSARGLERVESGAEDGNLADSVSGDKGAVGLKNGGDLGFTEEMDDKKEKPKEIAFFSEPKRVKKKTQRNIFIFQSAVCAAVCLIMLISKFAVPQLYENLHIYMTRLFGC